MSLYIGAIYTSVKSRACQDRRSFVAQIAAESSEPSSAITDASAWCTWKNGRAYNSSIVGLSRGLRLKVLMMVVKGAVSGTASISIPQPLKNLKFSPSL